MGAVDRGRKLLAFFIRFPGCTERNFGPSVASCLLKLGGDQVKMAGLPQSRACRYFELFQCFIDAQVTSLVD